MFRATTLLIRVGTELAMFVMVDYSSLDSCCLTEISFILPAYSSGLGKLWPASPMLPTRLP